MESKQRVKKRPACASWIHTMWTERFKMPLCWHFHRYERSNHALTSFERPDIISLHFIGSFVCALPPPPGEPANYRADPWTGHALQGGHVVSQGK